MTLVAGRFPWGILLAVVVTCFRIPCDRADVVPGFRGPVGAVERALLLLVARGRHCALAVFRPTVSCVETSVKFPGLLLRAFPCIEHAFVRENFMVLAVGEGVTLRGGEISLVVSLPDGERADLHELGIGARSGVVGEFIHHLHALFALFVVSCDLVEGIYGLLVRNVVAFVGVLVGFLRDGDFDLRGPAANGDKGRAGLRTGVGLERDLNGVGTGFLAVVRGYRDPVGSIGTGRADRGALRVLCGEGHLRGALSGFGHLEQLGDVWNLDFTEVLRLGLVVVAAGGQQKSFATFHGKSF